MSSDVGPSSFLDNLPNMANTFVEFYEKRLHTDIKFRIKDGNDYNEFLAHKLVLSLWSPVFADRLYKKTLDNSDGSLEILDLDETSTEDIDASPSAFGAMIKYMYGDVHDFVARRQDINFILETYNLATRYEVEGLRILCRKTFSHVSPNNENVFQLLEAIETIAPEEKGKCLRLLETNTAKILNAHDLYDITPEMIQMILHLEHVSFSSEYELISWIMAWVKNQQVKLTNEKSFREILEQFLPRLNILALTVQEFERLLEDREGLFTEYEGYSIFRNLLKFGVCMLPLWVNINIKRQYNSYKG